MNYTFTDLKQLLNSVIKNSYFDSPDVKYLSFNFS